MQFDQATHSFRYRPIGLTLVHRLGIIIGGDIVLASAFLGLMNKGEESAADETSLAAARTSGRLVMTALLSPLDSYIRNSLLGDMPRHLSWSFSGIVAYSVAHRWCSLL